MLVVGILLARILGPTEYGHYAYAFACMSALLVFADLGVSQYSLRQVARLQAQDERSNLIKHVQMGMVLVLTCSLLLSFVASAFLSTLGVSTQIQVLLIMLVLLPLAVLIRYFCYILRGVDRVLWGQSLDQVAVPILVLLGLLVLWQYQSHLTAIDAMWVQVVAALAIVLVGFFSLKKFLLGGEKSFSLSDVIRLVPLAVPFGLLAGIGIVNGQIDILMLGLFTSPDQVGLYRIAVLGAALVGFGLQAANVVLPTLFTQLQTQDDQEALQALVTLSARVILLTALPVAVMFWWFGDDILGLLFGEAYLPAYGALAILATGELIGASMGSLGFLLYMSGEETPALKVLAGTAVINVLLNLVLIPLYGMAGAAVATAIGQGLRVVLLYLLVVRKLQLSPSPFRLNKERAR